MGILTHIELCFLMGILILEKSNITIVHPGVSLLLFLTKVMYEVSYLYANHSLVPRLQFSLHSV